MEVSIYELLAAARESAKSDYIKGDSILCEKRFHPKGELHTKVSDRTGVSSHFTKAGKTPHKNKKTGDCSKRKLAIYPSPGQAGPPPGEGSFITGWEGTVVFLWR